MKFVGLLKQEQGPNGGKFNIIPDLPLHLLNLSFVQ